jgi:hypothetical protein
MTFRPARDAAAIVAQVDDGNGLGGLVETGHGDECCGWPGIVAEGEKRTTRRSGSFPFCHPEAKPKDLLFR